MHPRKSSRVDQSAKPHQHVESDGDEFNGQPRNTTTTHEPSPNPRPPSPLAVHEPSPNVNKPLFTRPNSIAPTERSTLASGMEVDDGPEPVPLDWKVVVEGIRCDLAGLWCDIRNLCDPLDEPLQNYVCLCSPCLRSPLTRPLPAVSTHEATLGV